MEILELWKRGRRIYMTDSICPLCRKLKIGNEATLWLHWQCFLNLKAFIANKHGESKSNSAWTEENKKKWLREYFEGEKETVQFT